MRKTKVVCTLGPATDNEKVFRELFESGMSVARLNFSHGSHDEHLQRIRQFKKIREDTKLPVALLLDTKGPEIRLKKFENNEAAIATGESFTLTTDDIMGNSRIASISYPGLPKDVSKGDRILIADGLIELRVMATTETEIRCEVVNGGTLSNNKGMNVPGVYVKIPFMSDRDRDDLLFGIKHGFDFIAASFTRTSADIKEMRDFLEDNGGKDIKIIAKIENQDGVKNIEDIIRVADGIMVARGDMGVEIPFEELPYIQKDIIKRCNVAGKPVITATQMLESMIKNPRPTRAEITDVANAIYDGTSAIMLSGETSIGKYPVEAVKTMSVIAVETEKNIDYIERFEKTHITISQSVTNAISHATCTTAHCLGASAIITVTKSGHTARMVSKYRPACPIIATAVTDKVYNQLSISWGVHPVLSENKESTDEIFNQAVEKSKGTGLINDGDLVVMTGGMLANISGTTNTIRVHIIGDVLIRGKGSSALKASGILCVIDETRDAAAHFNAGDIAVIHRTTDDILPLLRNASAIVTEEESDSKAVVLGKALEIPVITNARNATKILKSGVVATVNGKDGLVYSGLRK